MQIVRLLLVTVFLVHARAGEAPPRTSGKLTGMDLDAAWKKNAAGFAEMLTYAAKSAKNEEQVITLTQAKFAEKWKLSSNKNAYMPLREVLSKTIEWANTPGIDAALAKKILHEAMSRLDKADDDRVPDFLYSWLKSAAE